MHVIFKSPRVEDYSQDFYLDVFGSKLLVRINGECIHPPVEISPNELHISDLVVGNSRNLDFFCLNRSLLSFDMSVQSDSVSTIFSSVEFAENLVSNTKTSIKVTLTGLHICDHFEHSLNFVLRCTSLQYTRTFPILLIGSVIRSRIMVNLRGSFVTDPLYHPNNSAGIINEYSMELLSEEDIPMTVCVHHTAADMFDSPQCNTMLSPKSLVCLPFAFNGPPGIVECIITVYRRTDTGHLCRVYCETHVFECRSPELSITFEPSLDQIECLAKVPLSIVVTNSDPFCQAQIALTVPDVINDVFEFVISESTQSRLAPDSQFAILCEFISLKPGFFEYSPLFLNSLPVCLSGTSVVPLLLVSAKSIVFDKPETNTKVTRQITLTNGSSQSELHIVLVFEKGIVFSSSLDSILLPPSEKVSFDISLLSPSVGRFVDKLFLAVVYKDKHVFHQQIIVKAEVSGPQIVLHTPLQPVYCITCTPYTQFIILANGGDSGRWIQAASKSILVSPDPSYVPPYSRIVVPLIFNSRKPSPPKLEPSPSEPVVVFEYSVNPSKKPPKHVGKLSLEIPLTFVIPVISLFDSSLLLVPETIQMTCPEMHLIIANDSSVSVSLLFYVCDSVIVQPATTLLGPNERTQLSLHSTLRVSQTAQLTARVLDSFHKFQWQLNIVVPELTVTNSRVENIGNVTAQFRMFHPPTCSVNPLTGTLAAKEFIDLEITGETIENIYCEVKHGIVYKLC